jgi:periplasmic divalent cation tolerance protein
MLKPSDFCLVYVTCENSTQAEDIAKILITEKLCGCVNILPHMTSIYEWNGELQKSSEVVMLIKSVSLIKDELIKRIKQLHSYEIPCIIELQANVANQDFMNWLENMVS